MIPTDFLVVAIVTNLLIHVLCCGCCSGLELQAIIGNEDVQIYEQ